MIEDARKYKADAIWINSSMPAREENIAYAEGEHTDNLLELLCDNRHSERFFGDLEVKAVELKNPNYDEQILFKTPISIQENRINKFTGQINKFENNGVKRIEGNVEDLEGACYFSK